MYQSQAAEFPSECREASYKRRLEEAYPIHPELFDRLYSDSAILILAKSCSSTGNAGIVNDI
jgi:hypothetical protein